jgi:hypothetical protein
MDNLSPEVGAEVIYVIMLKIISYSGKVISHAIPVMRSSKNYDHEISHPKYYSRQNQRCQKQFLKE